jgi:acyl-CoA dehydrogenase
MAFMFTPCPTERSRDIADRVERFVRDVVAPYEQDPRCTAHGPTEELVLELRAKARAAGVMTPHILPDGGHLSQLETAAVLKRSGLSPLGPVAVNTMAPDEGNMFLLGKVATAAQKARFRTAGARRGTLGVLHDRTGGRGRGGIDPSMLSTTAVRDGNDWVLNGRKKFITGAEGARVAS